MLSFSTTSISKELGFISPLGSDKSIADSTACDMFGVLPEEMLMADGSNEAEKLPSGAKQKKLFKDIFSAITKSITTKQDGETTTPINTVSGIFCLKNAGLTLGNDMTLQELLNADFVIENSELGLNEDAISAEQTVELDGNYFTNLQDKVAINNEIKHFVQKFSDNKTTLENASTLEQNILADWEIASKLSLQIIDTNVTTSTSNNKENTLNTDVDIPAKVDVITTNNSGCNNYLQSPAAHESNITTGIENEEISAAEKSKLNDFVNDIELENNASTTTQLPDLSIEYSNVPVIEENIVNATLYNAGYNAEVANEVTTQHIENTEVINLNILPSLNSKEAYSAKNFDNKHSVNNHNYSNNKQLSNNLDTNKINSTFDVAEVLASEDFSDVQGVSEQDTVPIFTKKGKSNSDSNVAELKINSVSNINNINKIDDLNVANNTPKQGNKSNTAPAINSSKIDNIKVVLSKLLNSTPDSTTFGDKNIMLTTHKNPQPQFSVNMDEVLDIQSIEVSSEAIETKQVSDWVKAMPASKVNYIATNESYNLLENVVNNIVDKFYANNVKPKHNSLGTNKLPSDGNAISKQISLKFDSQTASEYKLSTSSIINEIFAKIESTTPDLSANAPNLLLNNELDGNSMQNIPKAITLPVAKPKARYKDDILFNINEIPTISKNSNLDIFIQEDNWEVLFDISEAGEHIIFQSDFQNTDVLSNNEFSEVKLNILSVAEEPIDVVETASKSYTVKDYKENVDVVDNATQNTKNSSTILTDSAIFNDINVDASGNVYVEIKNDTLDKDTTEINNPIVTKVVDTATNKDKSLSDTNEVLNNENAPIVKQYHLADKEDMPADTISSKNDHVVAKNNEPKSEVLYDNINVKSDIETESTVGDTTTKKEQFTATDKAENAIDFTKNTSDAKHAITQDNKTSYRDIKNIELAEAKPVKLENRNINSIPLNAFNLSELANNNIESKPLSKIAKIPSKSITNKAIIDDDVTTPKISLQNVSSKSINSKEISTDNSFQPLYNQAVSDSHNTQAEQSTIQIDENSTQPIVNKENTVDTSAMQQDSNTLNTKIENNTQPAVSRTFINIKPNEVHKVVWHTADSMLKEGSKVAAKSIKIVMNPQSLGDVVVEIKLQDNAANVSFKAKNIEALNEIEKNIGTLKDMLIGTDIKATEFKYEKINTTNDSSRNFDEFNQQQNNQQQSKNNQQQSRREFLNSVLNDNDSIKHDITLQNSFYKLVEEYV